MNPRNSGRKEARGQAILAERLEGNWPSMSSGIDEFARGKDEKGCITNGLKLGYGMVCAPTR